MGYVDEGYEELYSDINRLGRGRRNHMKLCVQRVILKYLIYFGICI